MKVIDLLILPPRIGRIRFIGLKLFYLAVVVMVSVVGDLSKNSNSILAVLFWYSYIIIGFIAFVVVIINSILLPIYRLHDIGVSGWRSLIMLIPVIDFIYYIYISFAAGEEKDNKYGAHPSKLTISDYVLIPASILIIYLARILAIDAMLETQNLGDEEVTYSIDETYDPISNSNVKPNRA